MNSLNNNTLFHLISFLNPTETRALSEVNKSFREKILINLFQNIFGRINENQQPAKITIANLISWAGKQPDPSTDNNIYTKKRFERWKTKGLVNGKDLREIYNACLILLENTQPTSIVQLQNQLKAFWLLDREIKDYNCFKSETYQRTNVIELGKKLEDRSREIFAKIGEFKLNEIDYDVAVFHLLADERTNGGFLGTFPFQSLTYGKTYIGIFQKNMPHICLHNPTHNLQVIIAREDAENRKSKKDENISVRDLTSEQHHSVPVLNRRHLDIGQYLGYKDCTKDVTGSDRVLDQKLTQIMMEIALQNKVISVLVSSGHSRLALLTASGFHDTHGWGACGKVMEELKQFRSKEENKLFPPYKDYSSVDTRFRMKDFTEKNVFFLRETLESWADIIEKAPLLNPNAAILPEYWVTKPDIIEG